MKFPQDAPLQRVVRALTALGFRVVRVGNRIAMKRANADGSRTPLTMPNHDVIKASTLRAIRTQAGIDRDAFLEAYEAT